MFESYKEFSVAECEKVISFTEPLSICGWYDLDTDFRSRFGLLEEEPQNQENTGDLVEKINLKDDEEGKLPYYKIPTIWDEL